MAQLCVVCKSCNPGMTCMFHCNVPANAGYACAFQRFCWDGVRLMPFAQSDPKVVCQPMSQKLLLSFRFPLHSAWGSFRASKLLRALPCITNSGNITLQVSDGMRTNDGMRINERSAAGIPFRLREGSARELCFSSRFCVVRIT